MIRGSDLAWRPGAVRLVGLKAPAEEHVDGALDLCVPVGVDDGVDHGVVGGWQQGGVGVHRGILPLANQAVDGKGKPAGPECPQDDGQSGDALFRGHVMRRGEEMLLEGNLVGVAAHDLADLEVERQHEDKDGEEGGGQERDVAPGQRADDAAGGRLVQAVPAQHRQQAQKHRHPPRPQEHQLDVLHRLLWEISQSVVEGEVTVHRDGQKAADGCGEGRHQEADGDETDGLRGDHILEHKVQD